MSEYTTQPNSADVRPVWGNPPAPVQQPRSADTVEPAAGKAGGKRISTMAKTLTAVGVAAVIAVGGTIAVTSANASGSASSQQGGPGGSGGPAGTQGDGGMGSATMPGGSGAMSVIGNALHGEFVVAGAGTATVTERIQTGAVTAVSSSSITVKSTDGFVATYVVGSGVAVTSFTAGTDVTVVATVSGTTVTATSITAAITDGAPGASGPGGGMGSPGGTGTGSGNAGTGSGNTGPGAVGSGQSTA